MHWEIDRKGRKKKRGVERGRERERERERDTERQTETDRQTDSQASRMRIPYTPMKKSVKQFFSSKSKTKNLKKTHRNRSMTQQKSIHDPLFPMTSHLTNPLIHHDKGHGKTK